MARFYQPMRQFGRGAGARWQYRQNNARYGMAARRIQGVYRGWKNRRTAATNRYLMVRKRPIRYIRRY